MDEQEFFGRLDPTADDPSELFEHFEERTVGKRTHHVLTDARHGVERGTVIVEDEGVIVRGFPSVPRILVLESGVSSIFDAGETVVVEEKLDGSNVRIANVDEPVAFTRGGYACPYTTARAQELLEPAEFFADHSEKMLCAELIGPETPYTAHDYDDVDSNEFRVFGIRDRETGEPLSVTERRELCEEYGFSEPRLFGTYSVDDAAREIREATADLDAADREGVVVKSADGTRMAKYTTGSQHREELSHAFSLPFDYGREFLFSRIVREAFQAFEFEEDDEQLRERAHEVGEAILPPMVETIRDVADGETVGERHTVRGAAETIEDLLDHLREQSIELRIEADYREDGQRVVEFVKVTESTTDRTEYYLEGGTRDV